MFRRILVPVDLSDSNTSAVQLAGDLVTPDGGAVTLLYVIETLDAPFQDLEAFDRGLEEKARRALDVLGKPLRDAGVRFEEQVCYGKRVPEIVAYAAQNEFDLVIIRSHRLTVENFTKGILTISHQVAIAAQTPVLVLK